MFDTPAPVLASSRLIRPSVVVLGAALIVFAIGATLFPLAAVNDRGVAVLSLKISDLPEGVSARSVGDVRVFLIRDGDSVTGLRNRSPGLELPLSWCVSEQVFVTRNNREVFDRQGRVLRGASPINLRRFDVRRNGEQISLFANLLEPAEDSAPDPAEAASSVGRVLASGSCARRIT